MDKKYVERILPNTKPMDLDKYLFTSETKTFWGQNFFDKVEVDWDTFKNFFKFQVLMPKHKFNDTECENAMGQLKNDLTINGKVNFILFGQVFMDEGSIQSIVRQKASGGGGYSTPQNTDFNDLEWDPVRKGEIFKLSNGNKKFDTGNNYISWNCILSKNVFNNGVHYIEVSLEKTGDSGFLFFGVGTPDNIPYSKCIGGAQSCLVAGYDARFVQNSHPGVIKHDIADSIPKFTEPQLVGLLIDMERRELSYIVKGKTILAYSNIPPSVSVFACAAHEVIASFTKHLTGRQNCMDYISQLSLLTSMLNMRLNQGQDDLLSAPSLLEWDTVKKGPIFKLYNTNKSFDSGANYVSWNCILSKNGVSSGVHYVEAEIEKTSEFLFWGVATPDNIPYSQCIGGAQSCLVAGYDGRFVQTSHPGVIKHSAVDLIPKFTEPQTVGLLIDMDRKQLSFVVDGKAILGYSNIPAPCHVFACAAHGVVVTLTKHLIGRQKCEDYISQLSLKQLLSSKGSGPSLLEWDTVKKGQIFKLSNGNKTFDTGPNYISWNCILSKNGVSSGVHYVEAEIEKTSEFLFWGVATPDNIPYSQCIGGAQSCLVAGYDGRFVQSSHPGVIKHSEVDLIPKFTRPQTVGLLIDMDKEQLSFVVDGKVILGYSNIPAPCHVFACAAHNVKVTLTKHVTGWDQIGNHVSVGGGSSLSGTDPFQWDTNSSNSYDVSVSDNNTKVTKLGASKTLTVVSKNVYKHAKFVFDVLVQTSSPGHTCIGVCEASFSDWTNYCCNSYSGRAVCGNGFVGSSDKRYDLGQKYIELRYGKGEGNYSSLDRITVTVDFLKKNISIFNQSKPRVIYEADISDLNLDGGLRFCCSLTTFTDYIQVTRATY